jgi:hypothetical protein
MTVFVSSIFLCLLFWCISSYDSYGRWKRNEDEFGGFTTLSLTRSLSGSMASMSSAEGRTATIETRRVAGVGIFTLQTSAARGKVNARVYYNGTGTYSYPDNSFVLQDTGMRGGERSFALLFMILLKSHAMFYVIILFFFFFFCDRIT